MADNARAAALNAQADAMLAEFVPQADRNKCALHEKAMKGMKNSSPAITLPPYRYLFLSALPLKKISHWLPAFSENQSALGCPLPQ